MYPQFVLPTPNLCELFVSKSGYAWADRRKGIMSVNFENQMFLHANSDFWSLENVSRILNE